MVVSIKDALIKEHSKNQTISIAKFIGNDKKRFKELMMIVFSKEKILAQRGVWVMYLCVEEFPELIKPYYSGILLLLRDAKIHDAIKRNFLRVFKNRDIPDQFQGEFYEICMNFLLSNIEPHAVRIFSMDVLLQISKPHPELLTELKEIVLDISTYSETPSIMSRAKRILSEIIPIINNI